jgi:hypothetical protein
MRMEKIGEKNEDDYPTRRARQHACTGYSGIPGFVLLCSSAEPTVTRKFA